MDSNTTRPQGNSIDGPPTLKSTFTFTRRARPPSKKALDREGRVPLASGPAPLQLARKESKGGLRGIFTRNKVADPSISPIIEDFVPQGRARSPPPDKTNGKPAANATQSFLRSFPTRPSSVVKPENKSSQPIGSKTANGFKTPVKTNTKPTTKVSPRTPRRTDAAWDPPPLFQAYPQAIKHALLSSSTLSADSLIRLSGHKGNNNVKDGISQSGLGPTDEQTAAAKKSEKAKSKHRRQISGSISKAEWTQKIYVLVTSGYLLQYAGEGTFDRLPEKMMQLGKDSVAFASDVIPGKHWVLQISQAMDSDGTPAPDARSLLSRLTFRGADYRRTATSLLLVLESAEDMESWITTVRREIEALGGKKYTSETGKPKIDDKVSQLKSQPSHRYLIQRDPERQSNPASPQTLTFQAPWSSSPERRPSLEPSRSIHSSHSTMGLKTDRYSIATSFTSDGQHLESLRESTHRLSYMSSGERTLVTSRGSTPMCSPTQESFTGREDQEHNERPNELAHLRPNATAISERRRSMQTLPNPAFEFPAASKSTRPRPHSTYAPSSAHSRNTQHHNQPMPNFSIPHTATKRSSLARIPDNVPPPHGNVLKTPTKAKESTVKSNRKSPPPMLQRRSLSPVEDMPSPDNQLAVRTPTEFASQGLHRSSPAIVDVPPRPRSSPQREPSPIERPHRLSNLEPPKPTAMAQIDFQFPPRLSSNPVPVQDLEKAPDSPVRTSPRSHPVPELSDFVASPPSPISASFSGEKLVSQHRETVRLQEPQVIPVPQSIASHSPRRPASMQFALNSTPKSPKASSSINNATTPDTSKSFTKANSPMGTFNVDMHSKSANSSPIFTSSSNFSSQALPTPPLSSKSTSLLSPTFQRLKSYNNNVTKQPLANRRSMPHLVNGPPPAPPPNCALPPLPGGERSPGTGSTLHKKRFSIRA